MPVLDCDGKTPAIHPSVYAADGSFIIGDVVIEEDSSVWFNAVLRGDINRISIGKRTNIQDGSIFHVTNENPVAVGDDVTIGHRAIVHGCRIGNASLIGMGSVILDGVTIGSNSLIAAGAVVLEKTRIPDGWLAAGVPARVIRSLTDREIEAIRASAAHYVAYSRIARTSITNRIS